MKKNNKISPEGTRDLLFEECRIRRGIENKVTGLFLESGYNEIITPGMEFNDVFVLSESKMAEDSMYKLIDYRGRSMVLRPDNTMPIARVVATRLKNSPLPIRLFYTQNVFTKNQSMSGRNDEITQSGIELIGQNDKPADLEVIRLAMETLDRCGVKDYKLEIGHAGIFKSLIGKLDINSDTREDIRFFIESKNYTQLGEILDSLGDSPDIDAVRKLPRLFGGEEVFSEASELFKDSETAGILDYLKDMYAELVGMGAGAKLAVDLGLVHRNDYYTDVIFRCFIGGSGDSVISGGRYNRLLGEFGVDLPAVGFAVNIDILSSFSITGGQNSVNARKLRIALTKGRLEKDTVGLFERMGLDTSVLKDKGRRLILPVGESVEVILAKAADVITYVEHGVCDLGVVGKDTILENGSSFYEILNLGFGKCRFALAGPTDKDFYSGYSAKRIATKYPKVARAFFESKSMDVEIIKIEGSVELAPLLGLADAIVDIVETGSTLKENGLAVIEDIVPVSARLIANMASLKLRKSEIEALAKGMETNG